MMVSVKHIALITWLLIGFSSCGKKEKELTRKQIEAKADSIVQTKMKKLRQQAKDDLEKRLPIELKPKVDSILKDKLGAQPVPAFPEDNIEAGDTIPVATPIAKKDTTYKKTK